MRWPDGLDIGICLDGDRCMQDTPTPIISPSLAAVGGMFSVTVTLIFFHNFCQWAFKQLVLMYCSL